MKLAAKLVSLLIAAVVAMLAIESVISIQRDVEIFKSDMRRDANQLGHTLKDLTEDVWRTHGEQRAMRLIKQANNEERLVSVRWVWLDEQAKDDYRPRTPREKIMAVLGGETASFPQRDSAGNGFLYSYVPLELDGRRPAALELGKSLDGLHKFRRDTMARRALLVVGFVLGGVLIVSVLGVTLIGRPLNQLIEKTRRVGAGDLSGPVSLRSRDELTELATALNQMCDRLGEARRKIASETEARISALEQLRHADRLATVGRLAAGVAHELGTPMNVTSARATMILEQDDVEESARIIKSQIEKMTSIIRQLLDFARPGQPTKSSYDVGELVVQAANMLAVLARKRKVEITVSRDEQGLTAILDCGQFQQVITNIIDNAIHAMPDGGRVDIDVRAVRAARADKPNDAPGEFVRVDVRDIGLGIDEAHLSQLFDPFFTTKDVGEGTGLGLAIAYGIVREHGGWIDVDSKLNKGSVFSIYLPREEQSCRVES